MMTDSLFNRIKTYYRSQNDVEFKGIKLTRDILFQEAIFELHKQDNDLGLAAFNDFLDLLEKTEMSINQKTLKKWGNTLVHKHFIFSQVSICLQTI